MLSIWGMDPDWLVLIRSSPCILPKKKKKKTKKTKKRTNKKYTTPTPEWVCLSVCGEIDSFSAHTKWKTSPTRWFSPAAADGAAVANRWSLSVCYSCRSLKFFSWRSASTEELSCNKIPSNFQIFTLRFTHTNTLCACVCVFQCVESSVKQFKVWNRVIFNVIDNFNVPKNSFGIPHEFELLNEKREGQNLYFAKKEIKQLVCVCVGPARCSFDWMDPWCHRRRKCYPLSRLFHALLDYFSPSPSYCYPTHVSQTVRIKSGQVGIRPLIKSESKQNLFCVCVWISSSLNQVDGSGLHGRCD